MGRAGALFSEDVTGSVTSSDRSIGVARRRARSISCEDSPHLRFGSGDRAYRYRLDRRVGPGAGVVAFIMLNPSTADERTDDPTIRRAIGFARTWGFGRLVVGNLFAYRCTDPRGLRRVADPVGRRNDRSLRALATRADLVVCAWGVHGRLHDRAAAVRDLLAGAGVRPHVLRLTRDGAPAHPLYLPAALTPIGWPAA